MSERIEGQNGRRFSQGAAKLPERMIERPRCAGDLKIGEAAYLGIDLLAVDEDGRLWIRRSAVLRNGGWPTMIAYGCRITRVQHGFHVAVARWHRFREEPVDRNFHEPVVSVRLLPW